MAILQKGNTNNHETDVSEILEQWMSKNNKSVNLNKTRILKAKNRPISQGQHVIPVLGNSGKGTIVKPIRSGPHIVGVEVLCRCGEKIVINFEHE
jgi:hypothetical protein